MPRVEPSLCVSVPKGQPLYRITSSAFYTADAALHPMVVNGEGSVRSRVGGRYSHPGVRTVYFADTPEACFAERLFYLQREIVTGIDVSHITHVLPAFSHPCVLWEVRLSVDLPLLFDVDAHGSFYSIFPSLTLNPSQDYEHLKSKRAAIQADGYQGLCARSTRCRGPGRIVVAFDDLSEKVDSITPTEHRVRLITTDSPPRPFINHAVDVIDFNAGQVGEIEADGSTSRWSRIEFNR